jgi:hypothetical protein
MTNAYKIPSIEEIYNIYHRETMFAMKGIYPRSIKNFNNVLDKNNKELLIKFQNVIKRGYDSIDWKIYIKACAQYFKYRFDLKILGSLKGNKIYRNYLRYKNIQLEVSNDEIYNEIVSSLKFLTTYLNDAEISLKDYLNDRNSVIPIFLNHIYAGSVSIYLYACLEQNKIFRIFHDIPDDIFFELFNCDRNGYLENCIFKCREKIICIAKLSEIINKINNKFLI